MDFLLDLAFGLKKSLAEVGEFSPEEVALWNAWLKKGDPELREDRRAGRICATLANCHSTDGGWRDEDFMLFPPPAVELNEEDDIRAATAKAASKGK